MTLPMMRAGVEEWPAPLALLRRRLSALTGLGPGELPLIRGLGVSLRQHGARTELCAEGAVALPRALVTGWACRQRVLSDGRRQIVTFLLPGDIYGAAPSPTLPSTCAVVALTAVETVDATPLRTAAEEPSTPHPGIARALRVLNQLDEVLLRDQIVRLGRQTAYERVAHLLLELRDRLTVVGLAEGDRFALPLTQEVLADALGLSIVHVNRTLQQLRRDGAVEWKNGVVTLLKAELLQGLADWAPLPLRGDPKQYS
jgi:CRP-like cAMP-binding protein